jgi:uncharacterized protein (TIGR02001 family)
MNKMLTAISICIIASPCLASADSTTFKDAKPKDAPVHTWLNNVSGSMALTTNYMFRGISVSNNNPAVQGGLTYTFPINVYVNVWGSNVNFLAPNGAQATSEFDTIVGYRGGYGDNFSFDVNIDRYNFPGARYANYNELNTLWTLYFFTLGASYSSNYAGTHGSGTYLNGTVGFDIPSQYVFNLQDVSIAAETGHYSLARIAGNSYSDYSFTVNKKISETYTVTGQWTATNGRAHLPPIDGNRFLATVIATF